MHFSLNESMMGETRFIFDDHSIEFVNWWSMKTREEIMEDIAVGMRAIIGIKDKPPEPQPRGWDAQEAVHRFLWSQDWWIKTQPMLREPTGPWHRFNMMMSGRG